MHNAGQGTRQDFSEAMKWFRKADKQGVVEAKSNIATMYIQGAGVPQDCTKGVHYLQQAASQNHGNSQLMLGSVHESGHFADLGFPRNTLKAMELYTLAAEQGVSQALHRLANLSKGMRVKLKGVTAKPALNGKDGTIEDFDAASGRFKVKMEGTGVVFKLKLVSLDF